MDRLLAIIMAAPAGLRAAAIPRSRGAVVAQGTTKPRLDCPMPMKERNDEFVEPPSELLESRMPAAARMASDLGPAFKRACTLGAPFSS